MTFSKFHFELSGDVEDVFLLAQCLYLSKQYHRAAHSLTSRNLHKVSNLLYILNVHCHF